MVRSLPIFPPLVSCLCVTYKRPEYLRLAIDCFLQQTYKNKQLIIVYYLEDQDTASFLNSCDLTHIKPVPLNHPINTFSLGELRNMGITSSDGDFVCIWDDDDWHNPERIERQMQAINLFQKKACILSKILMYDKLNNHAFLSLNRLWEGTILFEKHALRDLQVKYPPLNRAEDYFLVNELIKHNKVYPLLDPTLYIYQATGVNTCEREHFVNFFQDSDKLLDYQTMIIRKAITGEIAPKDILPKMNSKNFMETLRYIPFSPDRP